MASWLKFTTRTNHYIARVIDTRNENREIISRWFDGTQSQALAHFRKLPELRKYRRAGYLQNCASIGALAIR
jgi:hypothetical protein